MSESILQKIKKCRQLAEDAERDNRDNALDDLYFMEVDQWPEDVRKEREADHRPCLQINKLPGLVDIVIGNQRQNRPAIKIRPVDDDADKYTAEMLTGLIRNIESSSDAKLAYDTAFEQAVTAGFGYFRIVTEYADDETFDQEIKIKPIFNQFSVLFDPGAKNYITMEDAGWCLILHPIREDTFKRLYPKAEQVSVDDLQWYTDDTILLGEFFEVTETKEYLYLTANGKVTKKEPAKYVQKRTVRKRKIVRYLCSGAEILEGPTEWRGKWIPIIPVWGKDIFIENKRHLRGLIRHAKDPQRMYNYWRSMATETVALAPRQPYIGTIKQFEGFERLWTAASSKNWAYLPYNADPMAPGPPKREAPAQVPAGILNETLQSTDEIKATTGIYDASLGARGNETSGKAIVARQRQGDVSHFAFIDNLSRALRILGRQLVDLIPKVYDEPRVVRILGEDGSEKWAQLYEPYKDEDGKERLFDPSTGKYDVAVDVGPSYTTKRVEAAETMMEIVKFSPRSADLTLDLIADALDWPNKDKFVARLQKALPPELQDQDKEEDPAKVQQQQAMAQLQQQQQQMVLQKQQAELQADVAKTKKTVEETKGEYLDNLEKMKELGVQNVPPTLTGQGSTG